MISYTIHLFCIYLTAGMIVVYMIVVIYCSVRIYLEPYRPYSMQWYTCESSCSCFFFFHVRNRLFFNKEEIFSIN